MKKEIKTLDEIANECIERWEKVYDIKFGKFEKEMFYQRIVGELENYARQYAEYKWNKVQEEQRNKSEKEKLRR